MILFRTTVLDEDQGVWAPYYDALHKRARMAADWFFSDPQVAAALATPWAQRRLRKIFAGEFPSERSTDIVVSGVGTARDNNQRLVKGGGSHGE